MITVVANTLCPHSMMISDVADSGLDPLPLRVRTHDGKELRGGVLRVHLGQCVGCGARFARVCTWVSVDGSQGAESAWALLAPAGQASDPTCVCEHGQSVHGTREMGGCWCSVTGCSCLEFRQPACAWCQRPARNVVYGARICDDCHRDGLAEVRG